jgi:hypothetical protein
MNTIDLYLSLRYKLDYDLYTDYQITDALNYVMKEINLALNSVSSSLITTSTTLTLTNNEADLPSDLETIISVDSKINIPITEELGGYTYQIVGNKIKAQGSTVTIYYKKSYPQYVFTTTITPTTIDLPVSFDNMIKNNIIAYVTGQPTDIQLQTIKLIASRDGRKRPQRLIFYL